MDWNRASGWTPETDLLHHPEIIRLEETLETAALCVKQAADTAVAKAEPDSVTLACALILFTWTNQSSLGSHLFVITDYYSCMFSIV